MDILKYLLVMLMVVAGLGKAKCDVGKFDIIHLDISGKTYFMRLYSHGILKNGDLCYYNHDNTYQGEVKNLVYNLFSQRSTVRLYKEVHRMQVRNIPEFLEQGDTTLFILKGEFELDVDTLKTLPKIVFAENGNTYGYTYSHVLTDHDNNWIRQNKFEILFSFRYDICDMKLYAIKGIVSENEKSELKHFFENIPEGDGHKVIQEKLEELHRQRIMMFGFCSC